VSLAGLLSVISRDPVLAGALGIAEASDASRAGADRAAAGGGDFAAPPALRPFLAAALASSPGPGGEGRFVLAITANAREAEELTDGLTSLLPGDQVAYFPAWETLPHERISPASDTCGRRLAVLRRLAHPDAADPRTGPLRVVVTPIRGLLQPLVAGLGDIAPVSLRPGQSADLGDVITNLVEIGYSRTDMVERRGELAVRGGIVDVFPPTEEHPLRVEFFGDQVEEIRQFRVADQRSLGAADSLWAPPCRELLLTPPVRDRAKQLADDHPGLADVLGKLADGISVEGMEAFAPVLAGRMELLLDCLPPAAAVLACDPERIRARAADLVRTSQEFLAASWVNAAAGGRSTSAARPSGRSPRSGPRPTGWVSRGGPSRRSPARTCWPRIAAAKRLRHRVRGPGTGLGRSRPRARPAGMARAAGTNPTAGVRRLASPRSRRRDTAAIPAGHSRTCAAGWPASGGWCWSPRGTGPRSGWPRCCGRTGSVPGSATWMSRRNRACPMSPPG